MKKKYKALVLDIDGTIINYGLHATPTKKVINAIKKSHKFIKIILATSRPHFHTVRIIKTLNITSPCVVMGGAQIYDPQTKKIIWQKLINKNAIGEIFRIASKFKIEFTDDGTGKPNRNEKVNINDYKKKGPAQFWFYSIKEAVADKFIKELSGIDSIVASKMLSWNKGKIDVLICNKKGTKKHGLKKAAKVLNISVKHMIGVGDSHNDIYLLTTCGLGIAMGNATNELKQIADYIAPSVEDDGVAHVIEKFVL